MSSAQTKTKLIYSVAAFAAIILSEPFYRDSLYNYSLTWIPTIQSGVGSAGQTFWHIFTEVTLYSAIAIPVLWPFAIEGDHAHSAFQAIGLTCLTFLINMLKLAYNDPRPFWSADAVQAFDCSDQYGNPSGHSMSAFYSSILGALYYNTNVIPQAPASSKALSFVVALLAGSVVGYSRLLLGVHSINQVIFGGLIGVWLAFTLHYIVKPSAYEHLRKIVAREDQKYEEWRRVAMFALLTTYGALLATYFIVSPVNLQEWTDRIVAKCGTLEDTSFEEKSLNDFGESALGFGAFYGILYRAKHYPDLTTFSDTNKLQRLVSIGLVTIILTLPAILVDTLVDSLQVNPILAMFLGPFFTLGSALFALHGPAEQIALKLGLLGGSLAMYLPLHKRKSEINSVQLYPDMTLIQFNRTSTQKPRKLSE